MTSTPPGCSPSFSLFYHLSKLLPHSESFWMFLVSYATALLIGAFLECIMYGIFVPLFIAACYVQWEKVSHGRGINHVMAFATVFFGFTVTTDCVLTLYLTLRAVLYTPSGMSIYKYLDGPWPIIEIARLTVFQLQIVAADVIMVYRMFHIYNRNWFVCIIPSITVAALFSTACGLTNQIRDLTTPRKLKARDEWSMAAFCFTIFNSFFMTVAISIRLWGVYRETAKANIQVKGSIVLRTMKILIESAALSTTFIILNFCSYLARSNLVFTSLAMTSPAVGISFCLIIVRLGRFLPGVRDETWHVSTCAPGPRTQGSEQLVVPFSQVEVQRDVFVNHSRDSSVDTESQKQEYTNPSGNLPKFIRASPDIPTST